MLVFPLARDVRLIRDHSSDEAASPPFSPAATRRLSRYLLAHQRGARHEFAVAAPSIAAPLLIRDLRPILLLTTNEARPLVTLSQLQASAAAGQVGYLITRGSCPRPRNRRLPACSATVEWAKAHGVDVTGQLHIRQTRGLLFAVGAGAGVRSGAAARRGVPSA